MQETTTTTTIESSVTVKREGQHQQQQQEQRRRDFEESCVGGFGCGQQRKSKMTEMASAGNCCSGCREPIRDKFMFEVFGMHWHKDCIQCADCSLKLNDRCNSVDGKLYCKLDYWRRFGPKCFACGESIEQSDIVQKIRGNRIYHLKCFTCNVCQRQLKTGEQLHLIDDKKLLCRQDYHQYMKQLSIGGKSNGFSGDMRDPPQQQQQATYCTLICSNQANVDGKPASSAASGGIKLESSPKLAAQQRAATAETRQLFGNANAAVAMNESGEMSAGYDEEEELEEDEDDEGDSEDELELDPDLHELAGAGDSLDGMRRLLGYDNDNNLENEENQRSMFGLSGRHELDAAANNHHHHTQLTNKQNLKPKSGATSKQQGQQVNGGLMNNKRKRRRKQKVSSVESGAPGSGGGRSARAGPQLISGQYQQQGNKKLTSRNGESILNGVASSAASILAAHPVGSGGGGQMAPLGHQQGATHSQLHNSQYQHLHHHQNTTNNNNKSVSSSASTASNSSTSSSSSLGHQNSHSGNNGIGQQQQQQHSSSGGHNHNHQHQQQIGGQTGQANSGSGGHKPTRVRTVLNEKQLATLRTCYSQNPRPDALMKEQLVDMTGLSPRVIRVWFQNKRCKDKKKHMLYKQMQQSEKEGRHLAGLGMMRGVHMVASSPSQYDDHSTVSSTPGAQQQAAGATTMLAELQPGGGVPQPGSPAQQQQQQRTHYAAPGSVHSPAAAPQAADITVYQPHWEELIDYAQQHQQPGTTPPADRLSAASPRYQQLMSQIRGYNGPNEQGATTIDPQGATGTQVIELQAQQRQAPPPQAQFPTPTSTGYPSGLAGQQQQHDPHHNHHAHLSLGQAQQPQSQPMSHLHQFQR